MRDERLFPLFESLDGLAGVGAKLKPVLERLTGGETVWDLLLHLPERWVHRKVCTSFEEAVPGDVAIVQGEVFAHHPPHTDRSPHRVQLFDGTGFLTLSFFRADPRQLQSQFPIGRQRIVSGRLEDYKGERQIAHPDYVLDPVKGEMPPAVEPIYALTAGLTNRRVHNFCMQALSKVSPDLPEWSDKHLVARRQWPSLRGALVGLHAPTEYDPVAFANARERLAYDEALAREAAFALARASRKRRAAPPVTGKPEALAKLLHALPYTPTGAQVRAYSEIRADMESPAPMRRMLQGDVGSGKTLVGAMAAVAAASAGFQSAFMAPTEVLARQQYDTLTRLLSPLGYTVAALTGRDRGAQRDGILLGLAEGSVHVVAGTQALFQDTVVFRNLGLIIVDEQHRFGVADRMRLAGKGLSPHMLVMSATPIPRTLAQHIHGDLDRSILDEKPVGRQPIATRAVPDSRIEDVIDAVRRALGRGERVFWVCPKVDLEEDESSAVYRHAALKDQLNAPIGLIHGRLKPAEKDAALEDFRTGRTRLLVATTVIEVGVDVPDATIMVIERAESFGLAQLHQLRGRVGRGAQASFCILLYRPPLGETARERLGTLRRTEDGFAIAEADFRLRGPGDVLGLRQSGALEFRVLMLPEHADLLDIARIDATAIVEGDPDLSGPRGHSLRLARALFSPRLSLQSE
jgi:ATP-dependent DNA helicase RecG